jgi:hypothetical protein
MKTFLRENPTIAFGLGLPLLLVVVFLLISGIPALLVAPPQYDVLYATDYYGYQSGVQIGVVNQKVQVSHQGNQQAYQQVRLWRYNPKNGSVKEIVIPLPSGLAPPSAVPAPPESVTTAVPIEVPDLIGLTVDSSSIAPDGYEFTAGEDGYSGDITGLFRSGRYQHVAVLTKDGRSVRLPNVDGRAYYGNTTRFIGWVVAP